jgi:sulfatase maturation enzyme AslB (radical SAM superfamily)
MSNKIQLRDLRFKYNILKAHIIAVLVRILVALMNATHPMEFYQFVGSAVIQITAFGIYFQKSKARVDENKMSKLNSLLQYTMLITDLWMMSSFENQDFEKRICWAISLTISYCTIQFLAVIFNLPYKGMVIF